MDKIEVMKMPLNVLIKVGDETNRRWTESDAKAVDMATEPGWAMSKTTALVYKGSVYAPVVCVKPSVQQKRTDSQMARYTQLVRDKGLTKEELKLIREHR